MRICLVSRELAPFFGGGIGTYVAHASRALAEAGHEVHLLTERHLSLGSVRTLPWGAKIHTVDLERMEASLDAYPTRAMRYAMAVRLALEELHASHPFDFIEFPEWGGEAYFVLRARRYLSVLPGVVLAVHLHTPSRECREMNRESCLDAAAASVDHMEDECIRLADLIVSPSRTLLDRIQNRLGRLSSAQVIPHPLYVDGPDEIPAESAGSRGRVLYFGRIEHRKGVHLLVNATQALLAEGIDLQLDLVGADTATGPCGGSCQGYLEETIDERWRDRICFHGAKSFHDLRTLIQRSTVCCFPTLAEWENFPNTCLEAMALGSVIVASDSMAEILENGVNSLLFRSNQIPILADVLREALSNSVLRETLRIGAQKHVRSLCDPVLFAERLQQVSTEVRSRPPVLTYQKDRPTAVDASVLVLYRNAQEQLVSTLASIRAQSVAPRDIWVLNARGADGTLSLRAEPYGAKIHQTSRRSRAAVWNEGLRVATTQWVLLLEAGDLLEPTFVEKAVSVLKREPTAVLATSLTLFFRTTPGDAAMGWCPWGTGQGWLGAPHPMAGGGVVLAREAALAGGAYDEWAGDLDESDLYLTLIERGGAAAVIPEFLFHRRIGDIEPSKSRTKWLRGLAVIIEKHPQLACSEQFAAQILLGELTRAYALHHESLCNRIGNGLYGILKRVPKGHAWLRQVATRLVSSAHTPRRLRCAASEGQ